MIEIPKETADTIRQAVEQSGYDLVDIAKTKGRLSIYIDKPQGGITLDECITASRRISDLLETETLFPGKYHLEVSSPGPNRPLETQKDFARLLGKKFAVTIAVAKDERKKITGMLTAAQENGIILEHEGSEQTVAYADIIKAKIQYDFKG